MTPYGIMRLMFLYDQRRCSALRVLTCLYMFSLERSVLLLAYACSNIQSHKKFSEGKQAHVGMEALKTNQTRWESMTPQHFHTIPTSCAILPPLTQICFVFVSCVQRRVVEGSGVGRGGCVVHF